MKKNAPDWPTQSLIYFLICGAGILVFVLLIIVPAQETTAELDREIDRLSARMEEQRLLEPLFDSLLDRVRDKKPITLPVVTKAPLALGEIGKMTESLQQNVHHHNLRLQDIQTDVNTLTDNAGYLPMQIRVTGDFERFRDFLVDLGSIPSLEKIEEIRIRAIENSREFTVKIRLALAK